LKVWKRQPGSLFDLVIIEGDGTMVETHGEKKEGIGMNYKSQNLPGWISTGSVSM